VRWLQCNLFFSAHRLPASVYCYLLTWTPSCHRTVFQQWSWQPPSPLLAVPNVTAHPSTASVPTSCDSIRQLPVHHEGLKSWFIRWQDAVLNVECWYLTVFRRMPQTVQNTRLCWTTRSSSIYQQRRPSTSPPHSFVTYSTRRVQPALQLQAHNCVVHECASLSAHVESIRVVVNCRVTNINIHCWMNAAALTAV